MNYLKYEKQIKNLFSNYLKENEELEKKLYKYRLFLKNSEGKILDKKENLTINEVFSEKYKKYVKERIVNSEIKDKIRKEKEKFNKDKKEFDKKIKEEFLLDLSNEFDIDINKLKKILDLSLRRNFLSISFSLRYIEYNDYPIINYLNLKDLNEFINSYKNPSSENLFKYIYELLSIEIDYLKLKI